MTKLFFLAKSIFFTFLTKKICLQKVFFIWRNFIWRTSFVETSFGELHLAKLLYQQIVWDLIVWHVMKILGTRNVLGLNYTNDHSIVKTHHYLSQWGLLLNELTII